MQYNIFPEGLSQTQNNVYSPTIKELPHSLQPIQRINFAGPAAMSTAELLSIILGSGGTYNGQPENAIRLAERLMIESGGIIDMARMSAEELAQFHNVGQTKAARLVAMFELAKRVKSIPPEERPIVRRPDDIANLLMLEMGLLEQEHLRVVLLDTRSRIKRISTLYIGNVNTAVVRVSEIFKDAIRQNAPSITLVHNHPSGDPSPSPQDIAITKMASDAGRLMDIELMDHIIIGRNSFISLKDRGLM